MVKRDYYLILGVPPNEGASGIKAAYRTLAKRLHPDRTGDGDTASFRELQEAYEVLSNPQRRREYNRRLRLARPNPPGEHVSAGRWPGGVPILELAPIGIPRRQEAVRPSLEALLDRLRRNFFDIDAPKSEHEEGLNFEVILASDEAARGAELPVSVPVFSACPGCGGGGSTWGFPCATCDQEGSVVTEQMMHVRIPPMVRSGTIIELPLSGLGIRNLYLRLHIFVDR